MSEQQKFKINYQECERFYVKNLIKVFYKFEERAEGEQTIKCE